MVTPQPIAGEALTDVVLRDGSTVCLRHATEQDVEALVLFLQSLSPEGLHYRFHGRPAPTASGVRSLIGVDGSPATALVAGVAGLMLRQSDVRAVREKLRVGMMLPQVHHDGHVAGAAWRPWRRLWRRWSCSAA